MIISIYITRYSSIRTNSTILPDFFQKNHHSYYKHEMTILLLKPIGCNYSKDAPDIGFPYLQHSFS